MSSKRKRADLNQNSVKKQQTLGKFFEIKKKSDESEGEVQISQCENLETCENVNCIQMEESDGVRPNLCEDSAAIPAKSDAVSCDKPDPPTSTSQEKKTSGKHASKFDEKWQKNRHWLVYDHSVQGMFCTLCQKYNKNAFEREKWTNQPCTRLRCESVKDHEQSASHRDSVKAELYASTQAMEIDKALYPQVKKTNLMNLFACVYYLAKQNLAHTTNVEPLLDLTAFIGVDIREGVKVAKNATYNSHKVISEIIISLTEVLEKKVLADVQESPCFSIQIDETSDVSNHEQLILHARYFKKVGNGESELKNNFLKIIDVLSQSAVQPGAAGSAVSLDAATISEKVISYLEENNLAYKKLCGIGTDGAPVMVGKVKGVTKRLQERQLQMQSKDNKCQAIAVHCAAHRVNLAAVHASEGSAKVKHFLRVLRQLFDFFYGSTVRSAGLQAIVNLFQGENFAGAGKLIEPSSTRWLSHGEAVLKLKSIYHSIVLSLEREAEERSDCKAKGLLAYCTEYSFVVLLLFMCDVLPVLNTLSKLLQMEDIDLTVLSACVNSAVSKLQKFKDTDGIHSRNLEEFINTCEMKGINLK